MFYYHLIRFLFISSEIATCVGLIRKYNPRLQISYINNDRGWKSSAANATLTRISQRAMTTSCKLKKARALVDADKSLAACDMTTITS